MQCLLCVVKLKVIVSAVCFKCNFVVIGFHNEYSADCIILKLITVFNIFWHWVSIVSNVDFPYARYVVSDGSTLLHCFEIFTVCF